MSLPEIREWHVETLRLTVFGLEPISAVGRDWWKSVTKLDPEASVNRPSTGEYSESGEFLGGQFELKSSFNRVDWILSFPFSDMPGVPKAEGLHDLSSKWLLVLGNWLDNIEFKIARVAAGAVFIKKVGSVHDGNKLISDYLHFVNVKDGCEIADLMVQVNSPVKFDSVATLVHNRIAKMGVLERQLITIGPTGFPTAVADTVLRLELDMSSSVSNVEPIQKGDLRKLFGEMVAAYLLILKEGMVDDKV
ncbi:hypothetical protein [Pseudomonas sp. NFACC04-2]|uniref:hypothetical protein n=1 Tax=Pseudomonas sp. NFACC04-2 TaxID=1566242 RepID=UPI000908646C|nr:hypothetical protein [Pseudomonas sp. NFACC04-2]SFW77544.1 hypothetical protein SAMN03159439_04676 [Pseudomonas sp. NFACC04-2]